MKKIANACLTIFVSLFTVLLLFTATEIIFEQTERQRQNTPGLPLCFYPYIMYTSGLAGKAGAFWHDEFANVNRPTSLKGNNMGFAADFDYTFIPDEDYIKKFGKKENERIVLFTGGSVSHGVGASSIQQTISAQMEKYLNDSQNKYHYRVLNLGMGSWIAYQEFIALDLIGRQFDPDWIVVMDGRNDAASFSESNAGIGNPMMWPLVEYTLEKQTKHPQFEEFLIRHFSIYRVLSGKCPSPEKSSDLKLNPSQPDTRFQVSVETSWNDIQKQISFYLRSQDAILQQFEKVKFILSIQPLAIGCGPDYHAYYTASGDAEKKATLATLLTTLDTINAVNHGVKLTKPIIQDCLNYFLSKSALALEQLVNNYQKDNKRDAQYCNIESMLPAAYEERQPFFIDSCHLSDKGQELAGRFYANLILQRDFPETKFPAIKEQNEPSTASVLISNAEELPVPVMGIEETAISLPGNIEISFRKIPPSEFVMGSPVDEKGRNENEGPQQTVQVTKPFWISKYEVTQEQWTTMIGTNPSHSQGVKLPVDSISWNDSQLFLKKLNEMKLGVFRLPTETEWEYACRGKTEKRYYWGKDIDSFFIGKYAWYNGNSERQTHEVGKKQPNGFGLYDIAGNVWEWCQDDYTPNPGSMQNIPAGLAKRTKHVIRGGAFDNGPDGCRSAIRVEHGAEIRNSAIGFRLVMEVSPSTSL